MKPVISVIIPVYKVEPFLRECVDSVCVQTMKDLEIILVDDGSPDDCGRICDEYAARDPRIRVIHKENGGLSSARNAGLEIARGEYIGFVDSDDWIEPDMYEVLYRDIRAENAGIAVCGWYRHTHNRVSIEHKMGQYFVLDTKEAVEKTLKQRNIGYVVWNKLYRKDVFHAIRFPEGRIYEDSFVILHLMYASEKTVIRLTPKYHYRHREGSITRSEYSEAKKDFLEGNRINLQFIQETFPDLEAIAWCRYLWAHFGVLDMLLLATVQPEDISEHVRLLRENWKVILTDPFFSIMRKLGIGILCVDVRLYKLLVLAWKKWLD